MNEISRESAHQTVLNIVNKYNLKVPDLANLITERTVIRKNSDLNSSESVGAIGVDSCSDTVGNEWKRRELSNPEKYKTANDILALVNLPEGVRVKPRSCGAVAVKVNGSNALYIKSKMNGLYYTISFKDHFLPHVEELLSDAITEKGHKIIKMSMTEINSRLMPLLEKIVAV